MKRKSKEIILGSISSLIALTVGYFGTVVVLTTLIDRRPPAQPVITPVVKQESTLRFAAMGDMLAHDSVVTNAVVDGGYDFTPYFTNIRTLYNDADVVFCNPETPAAGNVLPISGYPSFNAPAEFTRDLTKVGCNMINLATNHMYDKGETGVDATLTNWHAQKPLAIAGAYRNDSDSKNIAYFTKNGITVAFVAYRDFSNAKVPNEYAVPSYHNEALVTSQLTEARQKADAVIVSAHWGTEDSTIVNDDQKKAAELFSRLGADVVIGTGPHVVQAVESIARDKDHDTTVWYSIGNMLSSQLQVNQLTGIIAKFTLTKQSTGVVVSRLEANPTFMTYEWSMADRAAERLSTRKNLMLYPLRDAGDRLKTMFPGETIESRQQFLTSSLGSESDIQFVP
ncbi:MAG: CapA family protein [Candidatus Saccharimonadales bacterium]